MKREESREDWEAVGLRLKLTLGYWWSLAGTGGQYLTARAGGGGGGGDQLPLLLLLLPSSAGLLSVSRFDLRIFPSQPAVIELIILPYYSFYSFY